MQAVLKRTWEMLDYSKEGDARKSQVAPGTYDLNRIPNPNGHPGYWLVILGTTIGMAEGAWRQWTNGEVADNPNHPNHGKPVDWKDWEIVIVE